MRAAWRSTLMAVMLGAVFAEGVAVAADSPAPLREEAGAQRWTEDLSVGAGTSSSWARGTGCCATSPTR